MTRVLFLDVDGVLATRRSHLVYGKEGGVWHEWDGLATDAIKKACSVHKRPVSLVISSTWRKDMHHDDLFPMLHKHGLYDKLFWAGSPSLWRTPILNGPRGTEIQAWLERASREWHEPIEDYRIIDDDHDMLEGQESRCIFTDPEEGMTSDNIKKLLNWAGALKA